MREVRLLSRPWNLDFKNLLSSAKEEVLISSPFINNAGIDFLLDSGDKNCAVTILTNLSSSNILKNVTDPGAVAKVFDGFRDVKVSSLGNLHAKIYIADNTKAIVTSANLTSGGIFNNFEYGAFFKNEDIVQLIRSDLKKYFSLGNLIDKKFLDQILEEVKKIDVIKEGEDEDITRFNKLFDSQFERINERLLRNRVKGKTINGIFSKTILYLLEKHGGLSTMKLHEYIKDIHPDICNDTINREINGQSFGKRWKHSVRGAQVSLKRQGKIVLNSTIWEIRK